MKSIMVGMIAMGLAGQAMAASRADLDERLGTLTARFEAMQRNPDKAIPSSILEKAQAIVLVDRVKAGFLFAFEGGNGVAMLKAPDTHKWGAPAFVKANHGSIGPQLGGEHSFYAIVFMNTNTVALLADGRAELGAEAGGTAGDASGGASTSTSPVRDQVLMFDDRQGLFGGAAIKVGAISEGDRANLVYYGEPLTMQQILFEHKGKAGESALKLAQKLTDYSKVPVISQNRSH
jgi:lipid-binding SYLF domain-containing protein